MKYECTDFASTLSKGTEFSAGFDLVALKEYAVQPNTITVINSGIRLQIPIGYYGRIPPRSSLALKGVHIMGVVIDCDYRGEVKVLLITLLNDNIKIQKGQKYAQIIFEKILSNIKKVEVTIAGTSS